MPGRGITSKLTQICLAWAVVSVSIMAAASQMDEVEPDSEVDVFLPALAKKLAKRSTTRKFRLVTTMSNSVAEAEAGAGGHDPNKAGQLAVINFGGQRRRQQQQQQRRRNRNNNNNNYNANNFNNNNILNSNPLVMNGTSYGVANVNPLQRRNNQRRRQQQVGVVVAGGQKRRRPMQILRPARVNRRKQNGRRRNNNNRRQNNRNNNNNLGVLGGQYQSPASKLPIAYPEPIAPYPNNNMYPNPVVPAVANNPSVLNPTNNMNPVNFNPSNVNNNNYPPATNMPQNFNPFAGGAPVVYPYSNNGPTPPLNPQQPQSSWPNPNAEVMPVQMQPEGTPQPPPLAQVVENFSEMPMPTVLMVAETVNALREY